MVLIHLMLLKNIIKLIINIINFILKYVYVLYNYNNKYYLKIILYFYLMDNKYYINKLLCGVLSGCIEITLTHSINVIKIKLQNNIYFNKPNINILYNGLY
jgi:hypothetical protein